jgi:hypothetical protein
MEPETDSETPNEGALTVFYWQDEPDHEDAWWWDDDWEGPTEEP